MKTLTVDVSQYAKIAPLLFNAQGNFVDEIYDVNSPQGCFGPLVITGDENTLQVLQDIVDEDRK